MMDQTVMVSIKTPRCLVSGGMNANPSPSLPPRAALNSQFAALYVSSRPLRGRTHRRFSASDSHNCQGDHSPCSSTPLPQGSLRLELLLRLLLSWVCASLVAVIRCLLSVHRLLLAVCCSVATAASCCCCCCCLRPSFLCMRGQLASARYLTTAYG